MYFGYKDIIVYIDFLGIDEILNLEHSSVEELSRIMVFVERREVAGMISRWLNEQSSDYRSARFVSTNSTNDMGRKPKKEDYDRYQFQNLAFFQLRVPQKGK